MAVLEVKRCLCVNDHAIPGSGEEHLLVCLGDSEVMKVRLVSLKGTGSATWLTQALGLPARWWSQNHHRVPILLKVLELIRDGKPTRGAAVRMPRQHNRLVQLHIRGRDLWFQNRSECVVLAIRDGLEGLEDLFFFLKELRTDIQEQQLVEVSRAPVDPPPEHLMKDLDEARQTVENHHRCASAVFLPSRRCLRVVRNTDKATKELRVKCLNKKPRRAAGSGKRRRAESAGSGDDNEDLLFDNLVDDAISFLEGSEAEDVTQELVGPAQQPAEPAQEPARPAQKLDGPAKEPAGPAQEPAEPTREHVGPAQEPAGPAQEPVEL